MALLLLIFKICEIFGYSKIKFFNFPGAEIVKPNRMNENHSKPSNFPSSFNKSKTFFWLDH